VQKNYIQCILTLYNNFIYIIQKKSKKSNRQSIKNDVQSVKFSQNGHFANRGGRMEGRLRLRALWSALLQGIYLSVLIVALVAFGTRVRQGVAAVREGEATPAAVISDVVAWLRGAPEPHDAAP
jgi:hypothetical protein